MNKSFPVTNNSCPLSTPCWCTSLSNVNKRNHHNIWISLSLWQITLAHCLPPAGAPPSGNVNKRNHHNIWISLSLWQLILAHCLPPAGAPPSAMIIVLQTKYSSAGRMVYQKNWIFVKILNISQKVEYL